MNGRIRRSDGHTPGRTDDEIVQARERRQAEPTRVRVNVAALVPIEPSAVRTSLDWYAAGNTQRVSVHNVDGTFVVRDGTNMARHLFDSGEEIVEAELVEFEESNLERYKWIISLGRTVGTIPVDATKNAREQRYALEDESFDTYLLNRSMNAEGVFDSPPPGEPDWAADAIAPDSSNDTSE